MGVHVHVAVAVKDDVDVYVNVDVYGPLGQLPQDTPSHPIFG
jgi:hypothetical protein